MSLVLIMIVAWLVLAVFACSLGRAAKNGDRQELVCLAVAASPPAAVCPAVPPSARPLPTIARPALERHRGVGAA